MPDENEKNKRDLPNREGGIARVPPEEVPAFPEAVIPTRPPRVRWFWVNEDQLERIRTAGGDENLAFAALSIGVFVSSLGTLFSGGNAFYTNNRIAFDTFIVIGVVSGFTSLIYWVKWWKRRKILSRLVDQIESQYEKNEP